MRNGPISTNTHAMLEPLMAILLIASPWIFGFSSTDDAKTICIVAGVAMLILGATTRWRYSLVNLVPLEWHFRSDLLLGLLLILSPFIFGFDGAGGATRFLIIFGLAEIIAALATNWEADRTTDRGTRRASAARA